MGLSYNRKPHAVGKGAIASLLQKDHTFAQVVRGQNVSYTKPDKSYVSACSISTSTIVPSCNSLSGGVLT